MKNKTSKLFSAVYFVCIISCILLSAFLVSEVWARYFKEAEGTDSARVARYVFAVDVEDNSNNSVSLDLSDISPDNTREIFNIVVTNENANGDVCEVAQQYTISAEYFGSLPLSYYLEYDGMPQTLPAGSETTHTYKLTVNWDTTKAIQGASANILDNASILTITVASEQID